MNVAFRLNAGEYVSASVYFLFGFAYAGGATSQLSANRLPYRAFGFT